MAFTPITGTVPQYSTADNELASGYYLKFYLAGTTTPLSVATDSTGSTLLAKIKLNPRGLPITNPLDDDTVFIPHVDQAYRVVLYKSEADADANNTANAEFNIASVAPDVAPSADAADITLRTNNLEAWDDYDRSPLFVDGTDFTAGAGPHVITVPADRDPTDADFRIWKLDAPADTVIALTATTETSTTFTLAETLLATDVIFVGDDQFRNIHDGDPADIRTRLAVYSKTEGDSRYLEVASNLQEIEDAGAAAQSEALGNLGLEITEQVVELGGDFSAGMEAKFTRIGNHVTFSANTLNHASSATPSSAATVVPAEYRPSSTYGTVYSVYFAGNTNVSTVGINPSGNVVLLHRDWTGANSARTDSNSSVHVSYSV